MLPQSRFLPPDLLPPAPQDAPAACKILAHECLAIRKLIDHDYPTRRALEEGDPSVYTGAAGIAYMYWRLATMDSHYIPGQRAELLERATHYSSASLRLVRPERQGRKRVSTFLTGAAGVYCVSAAIAHAKNDTSAAAAQCRAVLNLASTCVTPEVPSELLYGRAGFLSCLLFLAANAGLHLEECTDVIAGAVQLILADGQQLADDNFPLMWEWHGSNYLGAAHGLAGILTVLLHLRKVVEALGGDGLLRGAVDALLRVRYPSGNLPSSTGSRKHDVLVHWCHGAPGLIPLLCAAHEAYGDAEYLDAARKAADVVSERGLLRKGFGVCHGVGGNGLALLCLDRHCSRQEATDGSTEADGRVSGPVLGGRWRQAAYRFALFAVSPQSETEAEAQQLKAQLTRAPDAPCSLFEGLAGLVCLFAALLETPSSSNVLRSTGAAAPWLM